LLYDTKIKDFSFKFYADNKKAEVSIDIEMKDELFRNAYYEKIWSLESILEDFIGGFTKDEFYALDNGKSSAEFGLRKRESAFSISRPGQISSSFLLKNGWF
jgi:hypothetical protein